MKYLQKTFIALILVFVLSASAYSQSNPTVEKPKSDAPISTKKANRRPADNQAAKAEPFDKADVKTLAAQCVTLQTAAGNIELEMFPESAPESVRNFLNLAAIGAFDTTVFSRVVPGFVIQGGDLATSEKLTNRLAERAAKRIPDEPNQIKHERGILSMARSDEPNSASTHFFILMRDAAPLDGKFAAFGRVTSGMEAVEKINKMPGENETPKNPVKIDKATVAPCVRAGGI